MCGAGLCVWCWGGCVGDGVRRSGALASCSPGSVAAHAGLSDSFGGTNSGFGSADGCGVGGGGSQSVGVYLEIGLGGYFDHAVTKRNLLKLKR